MTVTRGTNARRLAAAGRFTAALRRVQKPVVVNSATRAGRLAAAAVRGWREDLSDALQALRLALAELRNHGALPYEPFNEDDVLTELQNIVNNHTDRIVEIELAIREANLPQLWNLLYHLLGTQAQTNVTDPNAEATKLIESLNAEGI